MKRARFAMSAVAVVACSALSLFGASAAHASAGPDDAFFTLSPTTVAAGGHVLISSQGWGDLTGEVDPATIINFETPASGSSGGGDEIGTAGGTPIVLDAIEASAGPWTYTLTVPADTPAGAGYHVCVAYESYLSIGDGGCAELTVTAAPGTTGQTTGTSAITLDRVMATPGGKLGFAGHGFTAGEKVDVIAHSTPVRLAVLTADAGGAVAGSVTLPAAFPLGAHTLELKGETSGVDLTIPFAVGAVPDAATDVLTPTSDRGMSGRGAAAGGLVWHRRRRATV